VWHFVAVALSHTTTHTIGGHAPNHCSQIHAAPITKSKVIEQVTAELIVYDIDIPVVSESHLKTKHVNNCVKIGGYSLFRFDIIGRKLGGVVIYPCQLLAATVWPIPKSDPNLRNAVNQDRAEW